MVKIISYKHEAEDLETDAIQYTRILFCLRWAGCLRRCGTIFFAPKKWSPNTIMRCPKSQGGCQKVTMQTARKKIHTGICKYTNTGHVMHPLQHLYTQRVHRLHVNA